MTFQRALRKQFPFVRLFAPLVAILAALVFLGQSTSAHEGHDHGPPAPELPTTVKPRITVHSDLYELVAILQGASLSIFLDHYATNEPISLILQQETFLTGIAVSPEGSDRTHAVRRGLILGAHPDSPQSVHRVDRAKSGSVVSRRS